MDLSYYIVFTALIGTILALLYFAKKYWKTRNYDILTPFILFPMLAIVAGIVIPLVYAA